MVQLSLLLDPTPARRLKRYHVCDPCHSFGRSLLIVRTFYDVTKPKALHIAVGLAAVGAAVPSLIPRLLAQTAVLAVMGVGLLTGYDRPTQYWNHWSTDALPMAVAPVVHADGSVSVTNSSESTTIQLYVVITLSLEAVFGSRYYGGARARVLPIAACAALSLPACWC
jgi:hypothetical protein